MIVLRDMHFAYEKQGCLFEAQNFEVTSAGFYSLFGRSGCGKTTLGRIISGLLAPQTAETNSVVCPAYYVSNEDVLPPWLTVSEHLASVIDVSQQAELTEYFRVSALDADILNRLPQGLSHGQRQRCNLARFLFQNPRILVLDEALSNVDQPTRWQILTYLKARSVPEIIVYLSHEIQDVILFSNAIYLISASAPAIIAKMDGLSLSSACECFQQEQYDTIKNALVGT